MTLSDYDLWQQEMDDLDAFEEAARLAEIRATDDADYERFCASRESFEKYMRATFRRYESEIDELQRERDALARRLNGKEE